MLALTTALQGQSGGSAGTTVDVVNQINTSQNQNSSTTSIAEGGSSWNDNASTSSSQVNISSASDYEQRTSPVTSFPPYLPYWNHGGWGTIKAYFPNSPSANDTVYETSFDPDNPEDMRELRGVLKALPHKGMLEAAGGMLNTLAVALFDAPDNYHHGRGLEIANSITRDRRPEGKPLLVFIDSNVDIALLKEEGYAYVGKVGVEGDVERNWDHAYKAAVAEALLWDTDILLVSGGMKGVTVGENFTFPSAAAGYSQVNYSLSLVGAKATGITEGKGKAVLSADAYRFCPDKMERRRIPESLYERIRVRPQQIGMVSATPATVPAGRSDRAAESATLPGAAEVPVMPQSEPKGAAQDGQLLPPLKPQSSDPDLQQLPAAAPQPQVQAEPSVVCQDSPEPAAAVTQDAPQVAAAAPRAETKKPGIKVSRELFAKASLRDADDVLYLTLR
jgi:hypothetical protein